MNEEIEKVTDDVMIRAAWKCFIELSKSKGKPKHLRISDVAKIYDRLNTVIPLEFSAKHISDFDDNEILCIRYFEKDNVYMTLLKSNPSMITFIGGEPETTKEDLADD